MSFAHLAHVRSTRLALAFTALVCLLVHVMGTAHELATPHRLCATHGERAHVRAPAVQASSEASPPLSSGGVKSADRELEADEHCGACLWQSAGTDSRLVVSARPWEAGPPPALFPSLRSSTAFSLLATAPKTSPPLVAAL